MSFFDDASLAFLPSGGAGKDTKAYSIKPTDGSGDFTFSRGSTLAATRVGPTGLIEKGRENLLLQSNNFDTTWGTSSATPISGYADRNGGTNAWLLRELASTAPHWIRQSSGLYSGIGTFSFYAKKKDYDWVQFGRSGDGGDYANFNISNGTLGNVSGASIIDRKIDSVGNGWYRCSVTYIFGSNSFVGIALIRSDVSTRYESYLGDGTSGTYIQDAQVEIGLAATDYIESGATTGKAGLLEDEPRFDYSGGATCPSLLLEPSRTTILPYSEYFQGWHSNSNVLFSYNEATSPEGLTNAAKITANGTSGAYFRHTTSATAGDNTFSIFAKYDDCQYIALRIGFFTGGDDGTVWFDIQNGVKAGSDGSVMEYDIEDYGNGWYRCYVVHNVDAADLTGYAFVFLTNQDEDTLVTNGTGTYFYGAQWEEGSYPTSYIPNHSGGSVTRGGDDLALDGMQSNGIFSASAGTLLLDIKRGVSQDNSEIIFNFIDTSNVEAIRLYYSNEGEVSSFRVRNNLDFEFVINTTSLGFSPKIAISWDGTSRLEVFGNGAKIPKTGGNFSRNVDINEFALENTNSNLTELNKIIFFPEALSDADCITLTT